MRLFKANNYEHRVVGKETSEEPNSSWICQERIGKAKCHGLRTGYSWEASITFVREKKKKEKEKRGHVISSLGIRTLIFACHSFIGYVKAAMSSNTRQDNYFNGGSSVMRATTNSSSFVMSHHVLTHPTLFNRVLEDKSTAGCSCGPWLPCGPQLFLYLLSPALYLARWAF